MGVGFLVVVVGRPARSTTRWSTSCVATATSAQWEGKELKVHGWVEAGSIVEKVVNQETHRTFVLQKDGKKIRVFSVGPKPDTFKDQSEVVATGHLVPARRDEATRRRRSASRIESDMPLRRRLDRADGEVPVEVRRRAASTSKSSTPKFK